MSKRASGYATCNAKALQRDIMHTHVKVVRDIQHRRAGWYKEHLSFEIERYNKIDEAPSRWLHWFGFGLLPRLFIRPKAEAQRYAALRVDAAELSDAELSDLADRVGNDCFPQHNVYFYDDTRDALHEGYNYATGAIRNGHKTIDVSIEILRHVSPAPADVDMQKLENEHARIWMFR